MHRAQSQVKLLLVGVHSLLGKTDTRLLELESIRLLQVCHPDMTEGRDLGPETKLTWSSVELCVWTPALGLFPL